MSECASHSALYDNCCEPQLQIHYPQKIKLSTVPEVFILGAEAMHITVYFIHAVVSFHLIPDLVKSKKYKLFYGTPIYFWTKVLKCALHVEYGCIVNLNIAAWEKLIIKKHYGNNIFDATVDDWYFLVVTVVMIILITDENKQEFFWCASEMSTYVISKMS